jgi:hypothetical protein
LLDEAEAVLERTSTMADSSILPEQTLILTHSLMDQPVETRWWDSLVAKLQAHSPNSEDLEALGALTRCARDRRCEFPATRMAEAFAAAEAHSHPHPKLLTIHSDWAWSVLDDRALGERLAEAAVVAKPSDADARITLARMNIVLGRMDVARAQLEPLQRLNIGGRLDREIETLRKLASRDMRRVDN